VEVYCLGDFPQKVLDLGVKPIAGLRRESNLERLNPESPRGTRPWR
jgi:hypothetical protein